MKTYELSMSNESQILEGSCSEKSFELSLKLTEIWLFKVELLKLRNFRAHPV